MRGVYKALFSFQGAASGKAVIAWRVPATIALEILGLEAVDWSQIKIENVLWGLYEITTWGSAAGTACVVLKTERGDQATAIATIIHQLTTDPTYPAGAGLESFRFSTVGPLDYSPVPEVRPVLAPGKDWAIVTDAAQGFTPNFLGKLFYREIG